MGSATDAVDGAFDGSTVLVGGDNTNFSKEGEVSHIADVDVVGIPSPCFQRIFCCAPGKDVVEIESKSESETGGKVTMTVKGTDGDEIAELIMNAVEDAQVMERD